MKETRSLGSVLVLAVSFAGSAAGAARAAQVNEWLGVTGEVRARYEGVFDFDFDESKNDDDSVVLLRTRLGADLKPHEIVRLYVQVQDSRTFGEEESTAADMEGVDLHQGLGDLVKPLGLPVTLRVGRQEIAYGQHRLIGDLDWGNAGRAFDGLRAMVRPRETVGIDFFWAQLAEAKGGLDDDSQIAGIYGSLAKKKEDGRRGVLEPYVIYRGDNAGTKYPGGDPLDQFTLGGRIELARGGFVVDGEFAYQLGERGANHISAMAGHGAVNYTAAALALKPTAGIEYNFASGDDNPDDSDYATFDDLFPTNHNKYGYMDLVGWRNINDWRAIVGLSPASGLKATVDYHLFALDEGRDALYRANGTVVRAGAPGRSRDVGDEVDLLLTYIANESLSLLAGYSHFFAGKFFVESGPHDDADFAYVQLKLAVN